MMNSDKEVEDRTESDVKDLRAIINQFDFIKNHDPPFENEDLSELIKTAELI